MENKAKISIQDLNLYYGDFHALKGINMELPEKEIMPTFSKSKFLSPTLNPHCGPAKRKTLARLLKPKP